MNNQIFYFFYSLAHQSVFFDNLIVFLAVYLPYILLVLAGVFILMHHEVLKAEEPFKVFMQKKKEIFMVFFSAVVATFIDLFLKNLIQAPRPFLVLNNVHALFAETGYAFPSGHATFFMALAVSIFLLHKRAGCVFMFFALIIGLARIIAGVHFPIDILGGFILGAMTSFLIKRFKIC